MASNYPSTNASSEIWVSLEGDDGASGAREAPFRSLRRAHEELCVLVGRTSGATEIVIWLFDGVYRLDEPLVFDSHLFGPDGPHVRISAAPGAKPVICGSVPVKHWTLHDPSLNIYRADVGQHRSRQLYVNGRRATRARTASHPPGFRPNPILPSDIEAFFPPHDSSNKKRFVVGGGIEFVTTPLNPERWRHPERWTNRRGIDAVLKTQWKMMSVPVREIIAPSGRYNGLIQLEASAWTNANLFFDANSCRPGTPSFWQVTYFENAYEFLEKPGDWCLDHDTGELFYIPQPYEELDTAEVELPIIETLVEGRGTPERPVANIRFEGIAFRYATWMAPSRAGYISDQSGFHVVGDHHTPNFFDHLEHVVRTPGNLKFEYAHGIHFENNRFEHLGAVALDFATGSQRNRIVRNEFDDISSAAIQLGGVGKVDHHPQRPEQYTCDNVISNNRITRTGRDFVDSAGMFIGFTCNTLISHNTISDVPWSGIAIGWGWGLLDPGSFPGVPFAKSGVWGHYDTPTPNSGNRIVHNHISRFIMDRWDGGAIYSNGQQGGSMDDALLIEGNVFCDKRPEGGGNVYYSDGGSRYVIFRNNASFNNPIGRVDFGPPPQQRDPLPYSSAPSRLNGVPYGGDIGGCRTYGDIHYENNYWMAGQIPQEELATDLTELLATCCAGRAFDTYTAEGFFNVCPYEQGGVEYPTRLRYSNNHDLTLGEIEVPLPILLNAGAQPNELLIPIPIPDVQVATGGASFPPVYSGPSWNVPRVSLPGLFGLQPQYAQEWWYYVGTAHTTDGQTFGLQIQIARLGTGALQLGVGITGIGWRDAEGSHYLSSQGFGLGAASSGYGAPSLVVPPVGDQAYSASLVPLLELKMPFEDLRFSGPRDGRPGWKFNYLADASAGRPVGEVGSCYAIAAQGVGYVTRATGPSDPRTSEYSIALTVIDRRGTVMEGFSGYVGPQMFVGDDRRGLTSYECAQPHLAIQKGGTLTLGGQAHTIEGGSLWLDRQLVAPAESATAPSAAPRSAEQLRQWLTRTTPSPKPLYVGDWMSLVLNDGHAIALAEFWEPATMQWITGTKVGKPPKGGFANLYFPVDGTTPQLNGGIGLRPRTSSTEKDEDWDFDVNILDPVAAEHSPHWYSPASKKTYATAWQIDFSDRVTAHGIPNTLYVFAISDNCEILVPGNPKLAFFEGAARVYADKEQTKLLGYAFVEQMGFN